MLRSKALSFAVSFLLAAPASLAQFVEDCEPLHTFTGEGAGGQFGWISANIADVDQDGVNDVAMTAPFLNSASGRVYVHSGATGALLMVISGSSPEQLGYAMDDGGDLNLDGVPDLVISRHNGGTGRVSVYSGADGSTLTTFVGEGLGDQFGYSVSVVGDLAGDGGVAYVIGARRHDSAGSNAGRAYVVSSTSATPVFTFDGEASSDQLGTGAAGVGDLNGDSVPDVVVSAANGGPGNRGRAYFLSGADGSAIHAPFDADATGAVLGQFFTYGAGDVDADGVPDVYLSDFNDSENGFASGKVYVVSGATGQAVLTVAGAVAGEGVGPGRGAGDVNGDGHADLIVAAWSSNIVAPGAGRVDVISGKDASVLRSWTGTIAGDGLGFDAHAVGDVDLDGSIDFMLTAALNDAAGVSAGRCYIVRGGPEMREPSPGTAGGMNAFGAKGAFPGELVALVFGFQTGSFPACGERSIGLSLPFLFAFFPAGIDGDVGFDALVPASLSGMTLHSHAVIPSRCTVSELSSYTFP